MSSKVAEEVVQANKKASQYFEKVDKSLLYHAGALLETDWFLCSNNDQANITPWLQGLSPPDVDDVYVLAIPHTQQCSKHFSAQELHQLVRELVVGIYVFNQTPSVTLETNHDNSMACFLPSAYADTFLGQSLFSLDYFIKSLLHGSIVSQREKRTRLNEKWRKVASENPAGLHSLYVEHGMMNMEDDKELGSNLYTEQHVPYYRYPPKLVDHDLSASNLSFRLSTGEDQMRNIQHVSRDVFLRYLEQSSIGVAFSQSSIQQCGSLLVLNPSYDIYTKVKAYDTKENGKDLFSYLHIYLQKQIDFVSSHLTKKSSIAHNIELLQFASFLILLLATLKQKHKTIDFNQLQPPMNCDLLNTDREVPPFLPTKSSHWSPYSFNNHCSSANGGIIFHKQQVSVVPLNEELKKQKEKLLTKALSRGKEAMTVTVNKQTYTLITLKLADYYPKFPRWIHAMAQELKSQCMKLPPISDSRVQEFLRRPLGPRQASKLKTINVSLRPCIDKGLTGPVSALLKRCTKTRINKPEEDGMALIHYAAAQGQAEILSLLLHHDADPNQPCQCPADSSTSTFALHLATKSGDLDSVCCLLKHGAQLDVIDDDGWSPVHHAAYHNYSTIIKHFVDLDESCVNSMTCGRNKTTPLLLAAQNGALDAIKCLVKFQADLSATNSNDCNIVHIATVKYHINVLQFLVTLNSPALPLWETLSDMLKDEITSGSPQACACVLDCLIRWNPNCYNLLLDIGAVDLLVKLASSPDEKMKLLAVQVLADISHYPDVTTNLVSAIPILIKHLSSTDDRLQSCALIVLCDLASESSNQQQSIAANGGIQVLVQLLTSLQDDVQLYATACLGILGMENAENKGLVRDVCSLTPLISLLTAPLMCVQGCAAASLQVLLNGCRDNQLTALEEGIVDPLVSLLRSKITSVHCNAAHAIESLAYECIEAQKILQNEALSSQCMILLRRLLKVRNAEVKVCGASALWAIAGSQIESRRNIANFMGIDTLVDLMALKDQKLEYVCSEAISTLATELGDNQSKIAELGGILPLVEVLLSQTSEQVYLSILHTLGSLLTKPGLIPNTILQKAIVDARGMTILTALVMSPLAEVIRVKAACTLAKLILHNPENEHKLSQQSVEFSYFSLLKLLGSSEIEVRLLAGYALSIFVYNNPKKLHLLKSQGNINISNFNDLLCSNDEIHQAHAAFQLVILSKLLIGLKDVEASIHGIKLLVQLMASPQERTKLLCAEFLACLGRCKEGIPLATVMAGAVTPLLDCLLSNNPPLEEAASAALGFFTYLPQASRLIRGQFRSEPELYRVFQKYLQNISVSTHFMDEWISSEKAGLPSLSLEKHGGPAVGQGWKSKISGAQSEPWTLEYGRKGPVTKKRLHLHTFPSIAGGVPGYLSSQSASMGLLTQRKLTLQKNKEDAT